MSDTWYLAATPQDFGAGSAKAEPITTTVDPGTGNVQVQFKDSSDAWTTPAAA